jgi:hypothetical protein
VRAGKMIGDGVKQRKKRRSESKAKMMEGSVIWKKISRMSDDGEVRKNENLERKGRNGQFPSRMCEEKVA